MGVPGGVPSEKERTATPAGLGDAAELALFASFLSADLNFSSTPARAFFASTVTVLSGGAGAAGGEPGAGGEKGGRDATVAPVGCDEGARGMISERFGALAAAAVIPNEGAPGAPGGTGGGVAEGCCTTGCDCGGCCTTGCGLDGGAWTRGCGGGGRFAGNRTTGVVVMTGRVGWAGCAGGGCGGPRAGGCCAVGAAGCGTEGCIQFRTWSTILLDMVFLNE